MYVGWLSVTQKHWMYPCKRYIIWMMFIFIFSHIQFLSNWQINDLPYCDLNLSPVLALGLDKTLGELKQRIWYIEIPEPNSLISFFFSLVLSLNIYLTEDYLLWLKLRHWGKTVRKNYMDICLLERKKNPVDTYASLIQKLNLFLFWLGGRICLTCIIKMSVVYWMAIKFNISNF